MHMAEARMKKTKEELMVVKEKQKEDEEHDFKFLRDKVAKVVGSKDAAECVVKEAIIHEVNEDAQDGINVFVNPDQTNIAFNNVPKVSLKKIEPTLKQSCDVEIFPGESHKPIITFVNTHNF